MAQCLVVWSDTVSDKNWESKFIPLSNYNRALVNWLATVHEADLTYRDREYPIYFHKNYSDLKKLHKALSKLKSVKSGYSTKSRQLGRTES